MSFEAERSSDHVEAGVALHSPADHLESQTGPIRAVIAALPRPQLTPTQQHRFILIRKKKKKKAIDFFFFHFLHLLSNRPIRETEGAAESRLLEAPESPVVKKTKQNSNNSESTRHQSHKNTVFEPTLFWSLPAGGSMKPRLRDFRPWRRRGRTWQPPARPWRRANLDPHTLRTHTHTHSEKRLHKTIKGPVHKVPPPGPTSSSV